MSTGSEVGVAEWWQRAIALALLGASLLAFVPWTGRAHLELDVERFRWRRSGAPSGLGRDGAFLPANAWVTLRLTSSDYLYGLQVASRETRLMKPDRPVELRLRTGAEGELMLRGKPLCGASPRSLDLRLRVVPRDAFETWMDAR